MGLSSLSAALSGLRASQQQISVISNNVANVSTPGFTRKILPQSSQAINGATVGVISETITRNVDLNLSRDLWTQISSAEALDVKLSYLEQIEKFHGASDSELSFAAEISKLKDSFASLSDSPSDEFLLSQAVSEAEDTAAKIRDYSELITTLRNDAQNEIVSEVTRTNQLLEQIAELNQEIRNSINIGRSSAQAEDQRDEAIKELSSLIEIDFFKRGDGVLVVQTEDGGVELAGTTAHVLNFYNPQPLSAQSYYPENVAGLYVVNAQFTGDPSDSIEAVNITQFELNGKLGGLFDIRDEELPRQMAQLDELAHKLASRFQQQGLTMFTDGTGVVPADDAPVSGSPATPVTYVGFSAEIQVNPAVLADHTLVQQGTVPTDGTIPSGSNEVIRRIIEFTFGSTNYQEAANFDEGSATDKGSAVDLLNLTGGATDLQQLLGLRSTNSLTAARDLTSFADPTAFIASTGGVIDPAGVPPTDTVRFVFEDTDLGIGPMNIDVDIGLIPDGAGDFTQDFVDYANTLVTAAVGATPAYADLNASFTVTTSGQLNINSSASIAVDVTNPADTMGTTGLSFLGFSDNSASPQEPEHPYFDIKVGNGDLYRITIDPGDTHAELIDKLILNPDGGDGFNAVGDTTGVPGLAIDLDQFNPPLNTGYLRLRAGDDYSDPNFGGDITIIAGSSQTSGALYDGSADPNTRDTIDDGVNVVSALFGTYNGGTEGVVPGGTVSNANPIVSNPYSSSTGVGTNTLPFRTTLVGPGANISTLIEGATSLEDFSQKMINQQSQIIVDSSSKLTDETALLDILQTDLLNESGVNLDEELANLVVFQTAFAASARVVSAVDELFQELLNAF